MNLEKISKFDNDLALSDTSFDKIEIFWRSFIRSWLKFILFLCLAIVILGGATRITGSGLSITEWKPIHGIIPPIGYNEWQEEFLKYQKIEQYQKLNKGISLNEFKKLYWWEWSHRFLARIIGLFSFFPFLFLCLYYLVKFLFLPREFFKNIKKIITQPLFKISFLIPFLVGFQGFIGWWMVSSGLGDSSLLRVSQYRLATHLVIACILILIITYYICDYNFEKRLPASASVSCLAGFIVFLFLFQIYLGAFVAGSHAGYVYNSWPLMNSKWIPSGLFFLKPYWLNFFENTLTIQFMHRMSAYVLLFCAFIHMIQTYFSARGTPHFFRSFLIFVLLILQAIFGIVTLLEFVPIHWALVHQIFALLLFVFAVAHWRATKPISSKRIALYKLKSL